jgi:hypothetical protein
MRQSGLMTTLTSDDGLGPGESSPSHGDCIPNCEHGTRTSGLTTIVQTTYWYYLGQWAQGAP